MKKFLLISGTSILLVAQQISIPSVPITGAITAVRTCAVSGYNRYRAIVVDHTQIGGNDLSNFPLLVRLTSSDFATAANGGYVQNTVSQSGGGVSVTVPADIVFAADPAGAKILPFEWESYSSTSGAIVVWVKLPTISHLLNTTFYVLYGKSSTTTFQGNVHNTWDSSFAAVWHLNDSSTPALDSSSNGKNAAANNSPSFGAPGQIGKAVSFASASTQYLSGSDNAFPAGSSPRTITGWYNPTTSGVAQFSYGSQVTGEGNGILLNNATPPYLDYNGWASDFITTFSPSTGSWHYMAATYDGTTASVYSDGSTAQTMTESWNTVLGGTFYIGTNLPGDTSHYFNGALDEIRVSNVVRSAGWITAEYNNQKSSSTMVTLGAPVTCTDYKPSTIPSNPNVTYVTGDTVFPATYSGVINVKTGPYSGCPGAGCATGNGTTDDSTAIQNALAATLTISSGWDGNRGGTLYFPSGTYLVSQQFMTITGGYWKGYVRLIGQNRDTTTLRVANSVSWGTNTGCTLQIVNSTGTSGWCHALLTNGSDGSAYPSSDGGTGAGFMNSISNFTINLGSGNPNIVGIDFNSSNMGGVSNVNVVSGDGACAAGINASRVQGLGDGNGPALVKNVSVIGCSYGIYSSPPSTGAYSLTYEYINLQNQSIAGIVLGYLTQNIREISSTNSVPAIRLEGSANATVIDGNFIGGSSSVSAIQARATSSSGLVFVRNITSSGYQSALSTTTSDTRVSGSTITEYSYPAGTGTTLALTVPNTPDFDDTNLANWVNVGRACPPNTGSDVTSCIQGVLNGVTSPQDTVYFPLGEYIVGTSGTGLSITNSAIRRIDFGYSLIDCAYPCSATWTLGINGSNPVIFENGAFGSQNMTYTGSAPIVFRHVINGPRVLATSGGTGTIYGEDTAIYQINLSLNSGQYAYFRQLDVENNDQPHTTLSGGTTWIFGYKTEGTNYQLQASSGTLEILGSFLLENSQPSCVAEPAFAFSSMTNFTVTSLGMEQCANAIISNNGSTLVPNNSIWNGVRGVSSYNQ